MSRRRRSKTTRAALAVVEQGVSLSVGFGTSHRSGVKTIVDLRATTGFQKRQPTTGRVRKTLKTWTRPQTDLRRDKTNEKTHTPIDIRRKTVFNDPAMFVKRIVQYYVSTIRTEPGVSGWATTTAQMASALPDPTMCRRHCSKLYYNIKTPPPPPPPRVLHARWRDFYFIIII